MVFGVVFVTNDDLRLGNGRYCVYFVVFNGNGIWKGIVSLCNMFCVEDECYWCDLYDGIECLERFRGVRVVRFFYRFVLASYGKELYLGVLLRCLRV